MRLLICTILFIISYLSASAQAPPAPPTNDCDDCFYCLDVDDAGNAPTCGTTNAAQWEVKNTGPCVMSSPDIVVASGTDSVDITLCTEINVSGNLEADDVAIIGYVVNGVPIPWLTIPGNLFNAVTEICLNLRVIVNATISINASLITDDNTEKFQIKEEGMKICLAASLPVSLTYFKIENNIIKWETASEINSDYFILEKSTNGISFEEIERIKGAGNSSYLIQYEVEHEHNNINTSFLYYRLTQVDEDGSSETFPIKVVTRESINNGVKIFPNPASKRFFVQGADVEISYLVNPFGKRHYSFDSTTVNGNFTYVNPVVPPGLYTIVGTSNGKLFSEKLLLLP